ncbi:lanthionine synthetase LanC family protein, partial [Staphylococcus epidermidis]
NNTLEKGIGNNITYCHGDIGSFEVLEKYVSDFENEKLKFDLKMKYNDLFIKYFEKFDEHEEIRHSYSFSLMIGISGVGISLLN